MAQVINTNVMSLNAQRNLSTSSASMATTIQRLSSGLRINSAKDDAAGLAIGQRFTTQIRGLEVAARNANDGISLAQTAEGALTEIGNNLQRIRELAVQSANATNSDTDRKALNAEVTQLLSEIDRVAKHSDFNGTKLLDGTFTGQLFQVGANAGQAIAIDSMVNAKIASLGETSFKKAALEINAGADFADAKLTINGTAIALPKDMVTETTDPDDGSVTTTVDMGKLAAAINAKIGETGVYAQLNEAGDGIDLVAVKHDGKIEVADEGNVFTDVDDADLEGTAQFAGNVDISTVLGAQQALSIVDNALQSINSTRADLGAIQNRFTSVVANLNTSSENLSASRSRIQDTDYAKETAELTRNQILQQAGTAMLAQAKSVPQSVLSLLQ